MYREIEESVFDVSRPCYKLTDRSQLSLSRVRLTAFLVHFNTLILKRSHKHFSFRNCSVGNAFLAAARDMLGGLPGAIFIFRAVSDSQNSGAVLPVILTNRK